jgi:hypothetical protein
MIFTTTDHGAGNRTCNTGAAFARGFGEGLFPTVGGRREPECVAGILSAHRHILITDGRQPLPQPMRKGRPLAALA